ncbi:winged helix-turn-helix domain-containing protein [Pseudoalteromonas xiamenensis]
MQYFGTGFQIDVRQGVISKGNEVYTLRAKTLQVIALLLREKDSVVSKDRMLAEIWSDVIVQEQVLVQSIKEIRDILGADVIRTFPRQGYQWVAEISDMPLETAAITRFKKPLVFMLFLSLLVLAMAISLFFRGSIQAQRIAFLPVMNQLNDANHNWVSVNGQRFLMDTFSRSSQSNKSHWQIVSMEEIHYAFERLTAKELNAVQAGDYYDLLQYIGADVVVATRLQGFPEDYQLQYTLYFPYTQEKGIVFEQRVNEAFSDLITRLNKRFQLQDNAEHASLISHDFGHSAFVEGINYYLNGQFPEAITMLRAAKQSTPDYLPVSRYLGASYANSGELDTGIHELDEVLMQHASQVDREVMRTHLLLGYLLLSHAQGDQQVLAKAETHVAIAIQLAQQLEDSLFEAYSNEEFAKIKRMQGDFVAAKAALKNSLRLHQVRPESYGRTATLIELAKVFAAESEDEAAWEQLNQAMQIAQQADVPANQIWVLLAKVELAQTELNEQKAAQFFAQAENIAKNSDDPLLIARVETFRNKTFPLVN